MSNPAEKRERMRDLSFALCGVCGDENDSGLGYAPDDQSRIMWLCKECVPIASGVYGAPAKMKSKYSNDARDYAGQKAGAYLEKIGKFDLRELTEDEWKEFLDTFWKERTTELRRLLAEFAPPF